MQVGRAVAKVLSVNELPEDENVRSLTLSTFLNKGVITDADWTITHEDTKKRYEDGLAQVKVGNMAGVAKLLAQTEQLDLPDESFDESTKAGVEFGQGAAASW
ncbi:isoflavone reductase family protein (CipA) [Penicillium paradoxum]|uniref:isoflavone reductase family protein (CipA) n=1 Tax=Penicillium paradoxum TaxID=176176 RepID=UPI00254933A7|nr:isoflavone reductase family protein (CipA) [Penicillium paradoxum]KAJ5773014.1 isoflavone reductase family protein (CipA) [Penicillium paradoxum]